MSNGLISFGTTMVILNSGLWFALRPVKYHGMVQMAAIAIGAIALTVGLLIRRAENKWRRP